MSLRLPSQVKPSPMFVSFDDAIIQPPEPADKPTAKERAAFKKAYEEYATKIRAARQTGDWSAVTLPGKHPTQFIMRPMPFEGHAVISGMRERQEPQEDILLLAARLCLTDIEGIDVAVDFDHHPRFGKIAALSTFEKFGTSQGLRIAVELGALAIQGANEYRPLD